MRGGRRQLLRPAAHQAGGGEARAPDEALRGGPSQRTTGRWLEEEDQEDGY
jgi:hypothetical protein